MSSDVLLGLGADTLWIATLHLLAWRAIKGSPLRAFLCMPNGKQPQKCEHEKLIGLRSCLSVDPFWASAHALDILMAEVALPIDAIPVSAEPSSALRLTARELEILEAMSQLRAFDKGTRQTAADIAGSAVGDPEPSRVKNPLAALKTRGLVDSSYGRTGGSWLTRRGLRALSLAKKPRKQS